MLYEESEVKVKEDTEVLEGFSLRDFAEASGIHYSHISRLKNNKHIATYETYKRLKDAKNSLLTNVSTEDKI